MTIAAIAVAQPAAVNPATDVPADPIWRLTVEKYHRMIDAGILGDDDPVELLEGWLVEKMSKNPPHRVATGLTRGQLAGSLPAGWHVDTQEPITTGDSEPEPDVAVIRGNPRDYAERHPGAADVALVVEVADATLQRDRTTKKRVYARAGVTVYWIVNLVDRSVEVDADPTGPAAKPDYRARTDHPESGSVAFHVEGREVATIAVRDLLP